MKTIELNKREKLLLQVLIAIVLGVSVYFLIVAPLIEYSKTTREEKDTSESKLRQLETIYEQYREIKQKQSRYQSLLRNTTGTTALIEEYANSLNILRNKVYTRDNPGGVQGDYKKISTDVKFEGVDITTILNFIHKMENSNSLLTVSYLRISQALKNKNLYDVTIKFETLQAE